MRQHPTYPGTDREVRVHDPIWHEGRPSHVYSVAPASVKLLGSTRNVPIKDVTYRSSMEITVELQLEQAQALAQIRDGHLETWAAPDARLAILRCAKAAASALEGEDG